MGLGLDHTKLWQAVRKKRYLIAAAVVGHHLIDCHAMPFKPACGSDQEISGGAGLFIGQ